MSPTHPATLIWFRHDLRLRDNPALDAAIARGGPVIPVFVWSPEDEGAWPPGAASRWWLHHSLAALAESLDAIGSRLVLRAGPAVTVLGDLARETGATHVVWNRRIEPAAVATGRRVKAAFAAAGVSTASFNGGLLFEPRQLKTRAGAPFQVFTPFWAACLDSPEPALPLPAPTTAAAPARWPRSCTLGSLGSSPDPSWAAEIAATWRPGEASARERLATFCRRALGDYATDRDRPDTDGTSSLSPHLHFGEIGPRDIWHAVRARAARGNTSRSPSTSSFASTPAGADVFLKELGWRELAHHLLFHFPHTAEAPLRPSFARLSSADAPGELEAWRRAQTGYPLVDAGMRQLWRTGVMHNRVRMVVASFLTKHLLQPWQAGARWFWDTLVDADLANNTLGWQWSAGCGADAAPFFRIFNPVLQGERFDPHGAYVRRWVPELAALPATWIHRPWQAPASELAAAGVRLGVDYPVPVVAHGWARRRALDAYASLRAENAELSSPTLSTTTPAATTSATTTPATTTSATTTPATTTTTTTTQPAQPAPTPQPPESAPASEPIAQRLQHGFDQHLDPKRLR